MLKRFSLATARLLGAWLAVCLVIALCVEGVSRLLFPYVPPTPWDYRRAQPPAYQAAPYFSPAFVDEAFSHQNWLVLPNSRVIYPGDYQGRWFNVKDGIRRTVGSPQTNRRILLVGSSTIYNAEVPDDFTIASYLQKLINDRGTGAFAVLNVSASGVKTSQQLERLKTLTIGPQDIVVFYDGTADAMQGVFYGDADGWIVGENRKRLDNFITKHRARIESFARHSRFFNWWFAQTTNFLPEHLKQPEQIRALAVNSREKMMNDLIESDAYVRARGAAFIHVLQPDLFTRPLRDFETPLVSNHFLTMEGTEIALRTAHEEFSSLTGSLTSRGVKAYDATALFNETKAPVYFDFAHTNELGNKMIADFLFSVLIQEGALAKE